MLCRMVLVQRKKKVGKVPVYLNVYDLTPMNGYAYWLGLGVYHSGVQGKGFLILLLFVCSESVRKEEEIMMKIAS